MRVLVACEESGVVRRAFAERGHEAWSNDLIPSADNSPHHYQMDCMAAIRKGRWDLIIMHPPCTYLALSGNRWYGRGTAGYQKRVEAVKWTAQLWNLAMRHATSVALENPTSVIFPIMKRTHEVQFIQPWQFGHPESKRTGFALHNLPPLEPTNILDVPAKDSEEYKEWERVWRMAPSEERKKMRSRTYEGVAQAMAQQWGG